MNMSDNLPQKYRDNIFYRFINKLRLLFHSKTINEEAQDNTDVLQNETNLEQKNNFVNQMKVEEGYKNIEYEKKKFMDNLSNNPELLNEFSADRLEKILQYYLDENNKKRELLKKLET